MVCIGKLLRLTKEIIASFPSIIDMVLLAESILSQVLIIFYPLAEDYRSAHQSFQPVLPGSFIPMPLVKACLLLLNMSPSLFYRTALSRWLKALVLYFLSAQSRLCRFPI